MEYYFLIMLTGVVLGYIPIAIYQSFRVEKLKRDVNSLERDINYYRKEYYTLWRSILAPPTLGEPWNRTQGLVNPSFETDKIIAATAHLNFYMNNDRHPIAASRPYADCNMCTPHRWKTVCLLEGCVYDK